MAVLTVTTTADSGAGSLRAAIAAANDGDVIQFDPEIFPSNVIPPVYISLSSVISVSKSVEIDGDGRVTLDGQDAIRVLAVGAAGKSPHIKGLRITGGAYSNGGGLLLQGGLSTVEDCAIENCAATIGSCGGVYATGTVVATLNRCEIFDNTAASNAGGTYANNTAQLTFNECEIHGNSAVNNGGGVYVASTARAVFNNCRIYGNHIDANGGALMTNGGTVALNNCIVNNNTTDANDQTLKGVCVNNGSVDISDSNIDVLRFYGATAIHISGAIATIGTLRIITSNNVAATFNIDDGAALTVTKAGVFDNATFTSSGRGYLATAAGIDTSAATLTNVVACAYGAGLTSFTINDAGAIWTADDLTTTVLLETRDDGGDWDTLAQAAGGSYVAAFNVGTVARAFDGARFWVAEISAYWQVASFVVANNGGGGAGDADPCWVVENKTITPNIGGV